MEHKYTGDEPLVGLQLDNTSFNKSFVTKEEVKNVEGTFLLRKALSPQEGHQIIDHVFKDGAGGHGGAGGGSPATSKPVLFRGWSEDPESEYKKLGKKVFYRSGEFGQQLFERIHTHIPEVIVSDGKTWKVLAMSERIRFVSYEAGQEFPPHMDGPEVQSESIKSFLSILFYLDAGNGVDFSGGELQFLKAKDDPTNKLATEKIVDIVPEAGLVVVMPHKTLHHSVPISKGIKHLIRNDILYQLQV